MGTQHVLVSRRSFSDIDREAVFLHSTDRFNSLRLDVEGSTRPGRFLTEEVALRPKSSPDHHLSASLSSSQSITRRLSTTSLLSSSSSSASDDEYFYPLEPRRFLPWNHPQRSRERSSTICESCRRIDFDRFLGRKMKCELTLGRRNRICEDCPFCRLVIDCIIQSGYEVPDHKFILLDNEKNWRLSVVYAPYDGERLKGYSTFRDARATAKTTNGKNAYSFVICLGGKTALGYIQYVADKESIDERRFFGRRVNPHHIDLDLIRSWLPRCQSIHGRSCQESGQAAKRLPDI